MISKCLSVTKQTSSFHVMTFLANLENEFGGGGGDGHGKSKE